MTAAGPGLGSPPGNISSARTAAISDENTSPGQLLELILEQGGYFQPVHSGALASRLQRDGLARGALLQSPVAMQTMVRTAARTVSGFSAETSPGGGDAVPLDPFSVWSRDTFRAWMNNSAHLITKCSEDASSTNELDTSAVDAFVQGLSFVLVEAMSQHAKLLGGVAAQSPALPFQVLRRLAPHLRSADLQAGEAAALVALRDACELGSSAAAVAVRQALSTYIRWKQSPFPIPKDIGRFILQHSGQYGSPAADATARQRLQVLQDAARELLVASQIEGAPPQQLGVLQKAAADACAAASSKQLRQPGGWFALLDCLWSEAQVAQRRAASGKAQLLPTNPQDESALDALERHVAASWGGSNWGAWSLPACGPEHLVRCAWAAGKLRPLTPPLAAWLEQWALRTHAVQYLNANDLAVLAWSMQNTAAQLPRIWRALEHAAMQSHELPSAQEALSGEVQQPHAAPLEDWPFPALCVFAQAAAAAHQGSPHMWALLMRLLAARRHEFVEHPGCIPRVLSLFRSRGTFPPRLTRDLLASARRSITALSPRQLGAVLQSCESSNLPAKKMFKQTARLLLAATSTAGDIRLSDSKRARLAWRGALQAAADSNPNADAWFVRGAASSSTAAHTDELHGVDGSDSELEMSGTDSEASSDEGGVGGGVGSSRTANLAQMLPPAWRGGNLQPSHVTELLHVLARVDRCPWRLLESVAWWLLHDVPDEMRDARSCVLLADALVLSRFWCAPLLQSLGAEISRIGGDSASELVAALPVAGDQLSSIHPGLLGLASADCSDVHSPGVSDGFAGQPPLSGMSQRDWVALHRVLTAVTLCHPPSEAAVAKRCRAAFAAPIAQYASSAAAALQGSRGAIQPQNASLGLSRYLDLRGLASAQPAVLHSSTGFYLPFFWPKAHSRSTGIALFFDVPAVFSVAAARRGAVLLGGGAAAQQPPDGHAAMQGSSLRAGASSALAFTGSSSHSAHRGRSRPVSPFAASIGSSTSMSRSDLRAPQAHRSHTAGSSQLGTVDVGDPSSGPSREVQYSRLKLKPVHLLERHCLLASGLTVVSVPFTAWAEVSPADAWRLVSAKGSVPLCEDDCAGKVTHSLEAELDSVLLPLLQSG